MGWERRGPGDRTYYYRKTRNENGRVVSTYVGNSPLAQVIAEIDAAMRAYAAYQVAELKKFTADLDQADDAVRACTDEVRARLDAALEAAGYRYHRGEWRKPRRATRRENP